MTRLSQSSQADKLTTALACENLATRGSSNDNPIRMESLSGQVLRTAWRAFFTNHRGQYYLSGLKGGVSGKDLQGKNKAGQTAFHIHREKEKKKQARPRRRGGGAVRFS